MTKLSDLSPAALSAAMRGGTDLWGQWGSAKDHIMYVEEAPESRRRKCWCGCGRRVTHRAMANGVCMSIGCELSMRRWAKRFSRPVLANIDKEGENGR